VKLTMNDGREESSWDCDVDAVDTGRAHHVAIVVDGGPKIITFIIDGIVNDGGAHRQFGWGRFSPTLRSANGSDTLRIALLYAQVVKQYRHKRVVGVKHRVVFGTMEAVVQVLAACGWKINTSMVERLNLDIRQRVAAIGRRVNTICQGEEGLQHQLVLFQVSHNFILPHASLRQPLSIPEPTHGTGSARLWRPCTPAMAAGLTDCVWSLRDVLLYRVPPWPQPHVL
jgi:hypothetical protein